MMEYVGLVVILSLLGVVGGYAEKTSPSTHENTAFTAKDVQKLRALAAELRASRNPLLLAQALLDFALRGNKPLSANDPVVLGFFSHLLKNFDSEQRVQVVQEWLELGVEILVALKEAGISVDYVSESDSSTKKDVPEDRTGRERQSLERQTSIPSEDSEEEVQGEDERDDEELGKTVPSDKRAVQSSPKVSDKQAKKNKLKDDIETEKKGNVETDTKGKKALHGERDRKDEKKERIAIDDDLDVSVQTRDIQIEEEDIQKDEIENQEMNIENDDEDLEEGDSEMDDTATLEEDSNSQKEREKVEKKR